MVKEFKNLSLLNILPESIREDPKIIAAASALDAELQAVTADIKENLLISRIDYLPENVLDLLAWQWHVDFYEPFNMSIDTKRKLIRESIAWHRIKGTPGVVEKVVSTVFKHGQIAEWYEYGGEPYYFRILVSGFKDKQDDNFSRLITLVNSVKNVRSWLEKFIIDLNPFKEDPEYQLHVQAGLAKAKPGKGHLFADTSILEDPDAFNAHAGLFRVGRTQPGKV